MARGGRGRRRLGARKYRSTPYPLPSCRREVTEKESHQKKCSNALEKKDWEDANCSVCMEYPHNAVLLLCSSHDKGCRPYMCGTSYRYSNCLDQFKKAYTKVMSPRSVQPWHELGDNTNGGSGSGWPNEKCEVMDLACPLCRGQVKGWTVVEPAREYLNEKKRSCMQDDCSFVGTYKELRKHVKADHPSARPREVDPALEQKWRRLEHEREHDDVMSTIRSSMPGAMVLGDYVIEGRHRGFGTDNEGDADDDDGYDVDLGENFLNLFLLFHHNMGGGVNLNTRLRRLERHRALDENGRGGISRVAATGGAASARNDDDNHGSPVGRHRGRVVELGRSHRRLNRRNRQRMGTM
ncbi:uncharacterized protein LOC122656064 [Telopea speciosissima]|uniref:uncharacterized protein LOC122656064 n=1 Tax=Telopea speciosissima TaxID=54955 RepID=UPI001CC530B1|nr:uncharacterized protein LOC122656064 [Telopea speciosissima]XP_043706430.1 uncharacterized protein LOC122656064 [Telopea speciosissima]XP_043706431.1 uncharacterized protein LOC122656064 [Telopea speciosissima]